MALHFENEINAMSKFIAVKDKTNVKHAEYVLDFLINRLRTRDSVFSSLCTGCTLAGNNNNKNTLMHNNKIYQLQAAMQIELKWPKRTNSTFC